MPDANTAIAKNMNQQRAGRSNGASPIRLRSWPWALGSIGAVLIVLVGAFIGRHLIQAAQQPPIVAAPATPPLPVVAVTSPHSGYQLTALDTAAGHLVALASDAAPDCPPPPVGACPSAPPLTNFSVLDGATGAAVATTPLTGPVTAAAQSVALLADSAAHRAYAVTPHAVVVFSTATGAPIATYPLPTDISWQRESGAALDPTHHTLLLAGPGQILALDLTTGLVLARHPLPASATVEGPALDTANSSLYLLLRDTPTAAPTLAAYAAGTLVPQGQLLLPAGTHLGPLDSASHVLYFYGADATVQRLTLSAPLPANGASALQNQPSLRGSLALGWNGTTHHLYTAGATAIAARDASSANPIAALPLRVAWNPTVPLLADATRGLLYLPDTRGVIAIVRDPAGAPSALTPGAAALLARASLAHFLPNTNQDPPFLTPATFPLSDGTSPAIRDARYWIFFTDLNFVWHGPYSGTAQTAVAPDTSHTGGYLVTFTITWDQLFTRTHKWVCAVAPDGSVQLRSDIGDVVP
ncbi:MAG: YncE family protein [Ktedonobacterales bacterium]